MAAPDWGVSVEEVLALAPHVSLAEDSPATVSGVWAESPVDAKLTRSNVEGFIRDVGRGVGMRLVRRSYLRNAEARQMIEDAVPAVVVTGAAATLISAVYPAKAGVNDQASYSAELWARYNTDLEALIKAVEDALVDQNDPDKGADGKPVPGRISGSFREPVITDDIVW